MQWVKADGTAAWIIDRIGQQVIDIDNQGCNHDQNRISPTAPVKDKGHDNRDNEVECDVDHGMKLWERKSISSNLRLEIYDF